MALARVLGPDYEIVFAADPTGNMVAAGGFHTVGAAGPRPRSPFPAADYLAITGPGDAFASMGYYRASRIRAQVEADRALIRRVRPDGVVTHMHPTSAIAARCEGVPIVSVADADFFVTGPAGWMPWLGDGGARVSPFPPSLPAFNEVLADYGQKPIEECSDLLIGDLALIASVPEVELPDVRYRDRSDIHYVGPLVWDPDLDGDLARRLRAFTVPGRIQVYASVGGGAVSTQEIAAAAQDAAAAHGWSLVLSGGLGVTPEPAGGGAQVLRQRFGGITAASAWAAVVVCHGGHSTVLAALQAGKPVVVVPAMSENEGNGRHLVSANGVGLALVTSSIGEGNRVRLTPRRTPAGDARFVDGPGLADAVSEVMDDPSYRLRAGELSLRLRDAARAAPARTRALLAGIGL